MSFELMRITYKQKNRQTEIRGFLGSYLIQCILTTLDDSV